MDLFNLSEEFGIPILADAQANRNKSDMENPENPELSDLAESDAIGQNSSRVISLVQSKAGLRLKITKNRYGENNVVVHYIWDIDMGTFRYTDVTENTQEQRTTYEEDNVTIKPKNSNSEDRKTRRNRKMNKPEDNF